MKPYKANWEIQGLPGAHITAPGAIVRLEEETAAPLIQCGVLSPCADQSESAQTDGDASSIDLSGMNKAQLVEYAREKLGLALDINRKKDELLAMIAEAVGPDTEV